MTRRVLRAPLLASVAAIGTACSGGGPTASPVGLESGTSPAPSEPSPDAPESGSGADAEPCSPLLGTVRPGARLSYRGATGTPFTMVRTVSRFERDGEEAEVELVVVQESGGTQPSRVTTTLEYRCAADATYLVRMKQSVTPRGGRTTTSITEYDGRGALAFPRVVDVGTTWTMASRGRRTVDGKSDRFVLDVRHVMRGRADVTVPAGTFKTLEVEQTPDDAGARPDTLWFAEGVGVVRTNSYELVEKTP